jgi:hypothetical protein
MIEKSDKMVIEELIDEKASKMKKKSKARKDKVDIEIINPGKSKKKDNNMHRKGSLPRIGNSFV